MTRNMKMRMVANVLAAALAVLMALQGLALPARAQGPAAPQIPWELAQNFFEVQGALTYSLIPTDGSVAIRLTEAIRWAWMLFGACPFKAVPVVTTAGQAMLAILFRLQMPLVFVVLPPSMIGHTTFFQPPAGAHWDPGLQLWVWKNGCYDPKTGGTCN